jgi:hypothetical protein
MICLILKQFGDHSHANLYLIFYQSLAATKLDNYDRDTMCDWPRE